MTAPAPSPDPLERFRALALADDDVAQALWRLIDVRDFAERALALAAAHGIALTPAMLATATRPDPLGMSRWTLEPVTGTNWPSAGWRPMHVLVSGHAAAVDWAFFGDMPLTAPFYEDTIRRVLSRPFSRLLRYRMTLDDFVAAAPQAPPPSGFVFHMSRCGSTLVSQMLAAVPRYSVISEAAPFDVMVQLSRLWPHLPPERHMRHLTAMAAALCRGPGGHVFKLDSWHTMALPLLRRAFPTVPWVFLYRDPVEVLVSQMRQRGSQIVPELTPPALYGITDFDGLLDVEYCARVLEKTCAAVPDHIGDGAGKLVSYAELPEAVCATILPHFAMACSEEDRARMMAVAGRNAKFPTDTFAGDSESKQQEATSALREAANHLAGVYARLESLRTAYAAIRTGSFS